MTLLICQGIQIDSVQDLIVTSIIFEQTVSRRIPLPLTLTDIHQTWRKSGENHSVTKKPITFVKEKPSDFIHSIKDNRNRQVL